MEVVLKDWTGVRAMRHPACFDSYPEEIRCPYCGRKEILKKQRALRRNRISKMSYPQCKDYHEGDSDRRPVLEVFGG